MCKERVFKIDKLYISLYKNKLVKYLDKYETISVLIDRKKLIVKFCFYLLLIKLIS